MRLLAIGTMVLVVAAAMPASAQIAGSMRGLSGGTGPTIRGDIRLPTSANPTVGRSVSVSREVRGVRNDIEAGRKAGQLSSNEARALRREAYRIESMRARFAQGGYTEAEVVLLRGRTEALRGGRDAAHPGTHGQIAGGGVAVATPPGPDQKDAHSSLAPAVASGLTGET